MPKDSDQITGKLNKSLGLLFPMPTFSSLSEFESDTSGSSNFNAHVLGGFFGLGSFGNVKPSQG